MSRVIDVREEPGRVAIVLRRSTFWKATVIPIAQVAALVIVTAVREPHSQEDRVVGALIGLGGGFVLGLFLLWIAYLLVGREEIVAVSGTQLLLDRQILRRPELRKRRTYAIDRVVNLRAVEPTRPPQTWDACLAFDYGGSTVNFGQGVARSDADRVLKALATAVPAWMSEPAKPPAALTARSRAWSRVTFLIAALSIACLVEVGLAWPLDRTKMTLPLAIAIVSGAYIPMWAFIVLIAEARAFWRLPNWVGFVAVVYLLASYFVPPFYVTTWVVDSLLSPFRSVNRHDVGYILLVNMALPLGGFFWAVYRAGKRGWIPREERGVSSVISGRPPGISPGGA